MPPSMETREERLATWAEPPSNREHHKLRFLTGSIFSYPNNQGQYVRIKEDSIHFDQIQSRLFQPPKDDVDGSFPLWHFKLLSLPRLRPGRLALSLPKHIFHTIQQAWNLHSRTIETFLSNNGVFGTFPSCSNNSSGRSSLLLKVANSRSTGFDCVSITRDLACRTTYVLYHHLSDEASVFTNLLATPERCIDHHFFAAALYRSHHQHVETHRSTIDETILGIERGTNVGRTGKLISPWRRQSVDGEYPALAGVDPKKTILQLSYCQTDLAIIGHVARCCLECGEGIVRAVDESLRSGQELKTQQDGGGPAHDSPLEQRDKALSMALRAAQMAVRDEVEYTRRRIAMLLSQVEQMRQRTQSQTDLMLSSITQNDAEYTAAIAVDGKRDSVAVKTISILGIVYLPPTFMATLFSVGMFDWGVGGPNTSTATDDGAGTSGLRTSPSTWVYFVVTVPLTLVTFLVWWFWSAREYRKTSRRFMGYHARKTDERSTVAPGTSGLGLNEKMV